MRKINKTILDRLSNTIQTKENNSNPTTTLWITRSQTPLLKEDFLDRQYILDDSIEDVSIAVSHPKIHLSDESIYIAYISNGVINLVYSDVKTNISAQIWQKIPFGREATAVSIVFNGTMSTLINRKIEFITKEPWIFWVDKGALYGQSLYSDEVIVLAEDECTDVSAICAMDDFGLIVFFIINGKLYYRQLIKGTWYNAEIINFGPTGITWAEVSSFRTWDYRIGVQLKSTTGEIYEMFSQFMGIGKYNTEHVDVSDITPESKLLKVYEKSSNIAENIDVSNVSVDIPYGGLYSTNVPRIISVKNIEDDYGNWGRYINVTFDNYIDATSLINATAFTFIDHSNNKYVGISIALVESTGKDVLIDFGNFDIAGGGCTLTYIPGVVKSLAGVSVPESSFKFNVKNTTGSTIVMPVNFRNTNSDGTEIEIEFSDDIDSIEGNENAFTVTINEYDYVPGGTLSSKNKTVNSVIKQNNNTLLLQFDSNNSIRNAVGEVKITYSNGTIVDNGGLLPSFTKSFVPEGLIPKNNPNGIEHIDISDIVLQGRLVKINIMDSKDNEHVDVSDVVASGTLTHVDNI